jgi:hypothetical protein
MMNTCRLYYLNLFKRHVECRKALIQEPRVYTKFSKCDIYDFVSLTDPNIHLWHTKKTLSTLSIRRRYNTKIAVFWVVGPCSVVEVYRRFTSACCLHHQGVGKLLPDYTVQQPRRQSASYSPPKISLRHNTIHNLSFIVNSLITKNGRDITLHGGNNCFLPSLLLNTFILYYHTATAVAPTTTPWGRVSLQTLIITRLVKKCPNFVVPENSLPYL